MSDVTLRRVRRPPVPRESLLPHDLRVLAFCDSFRPGVGGGAERVAYEVYRRLAAAGARITVVTTSRDGDRWPDESAGPHIVELPSIDLTRRLGMQASLLRGGMGAVEAIVQELQPHVLVANSLQFQTSLLAARVQRRTGLPMILTAHIAGFEALPSILRLPVHVHERILGRFVLSRSQRVIAVSEQVAEHLRWHTPSKERLRIVPNGVDHDRFHPGDRSRAASAPVRVVFIGRLVRNKGADQLIDAFGEVRRRGASAELVIVGDGPLRIPLERRTADAGLSGDVRFVGRSDRVDDLLREADVLVRPSFTEGMPLAVLEAMASRVCVVASDVPGNAAVIDNDRTGLLVPAGDVGALAGALERVLDDESLRARLAEAAYDASSEYSWDLCASATLSVIREVLHSRAEGMHP